MTVFLAFRLHGFNLLTLKAQWLLQCAHKVHFYPFYYYQKRIYISPNSLCLAGLHGPDGLSLLRGTNYLFKHDSDKYSAGKA
jgi:hypothetical protein